MTTQEQCLNVLEDTALLLQKAQTNLKKCPKQRLTRGYIETRIQSVTEYWATFRNAHQDLVKCVPKEKKTDMTYFANEDYYVYEDLYSCLMADLRDLLSTFTHPKLSEASSSMEGQVKLPRIHLPIFSGVYEEWPSFNDLFISLVHKNASLSNVQKIHYLKSSVTGEAEALLKHIQVTETNYEQAWNTLSARYGNKRLIVHSVLKKLFFQKKIPIQTTNHIKSLLDTTNECLNSLRNLNISIDSWDPMIIFLVVQKLDPESHREWEQFAYRDDMEELPRWEDIVKFLQTKFHTLELISPTSKEKSPTNINHAVHVSMPDTTKPRNCILCNENHTLCHCREFSKMEPAERCETVKKYNLCFNCLASGHPAMKCRLNMFCRLCNKRHHTLVHTATRMNTPTQDENLPMHHGMIEDEEVSNDTPFEEPNVELLSHVATYSSTSLLATALVLVKGETGHTTVLRALVDHGSQATFISERAARILKLNRTPIKGTITGIGSTKTAVKHATNIELLSRHEKSFNLKVKVYVMSTPLTTQLPSQPISTNTWPHLKGLVLADPGFNQPGRIDLLLGVEVCAQIMKGEVIKGPPGTPCAQNTSLGWILFGNIQNEKQQHDFTVMHLNWDLEDVLEMKTKKVKTAEEGKCEKIYQATRSRTDEGRYVVKVPKKRDNLSVTRLGTEINLEKNKRLKTEMREYKEINHMEYVQKEEIKNFAVYLPQHKIEKEKKKKTKVKPVCNSSMGKNNASLNYELLVGPQPQNRYLQRIFWRSNSKEPVRDYKLTKATFGTASTPYLAVKTLQQNEGKSNTNQTLLKS